MVWSNGGGHNYGTCDWGGVWHNYAKGQAWSGAGSGCIIGWARGGIWCEYPID